MPLVAHVDAGCAAEVIAGEDVRVPKETNDDALTTSAIVARLLLLAAVVFYAC